MPEKSLEQILIKFSDDMADAREGECVDEIYDKAIQTIKNYYLAKLPKEKVIEKGNQEFKKGINFAITEIRKAIEEG